MPKDVYDITQYEDSELYEMLDMSPTSSDREIEAKIIHLVRQYMQYDSEEGQKIVDFYQKIYNRLFAVEEEDKEKNNVEGFEVEQTGENRYIGVDRTSNNSNRYYNMNPAEEGELIVGKNDTREMSNTISTATDYRKGDTLLTKPLDYSKDQLNPLLKQTIRRIINIDSQYRENKSSTLPSDFTFNLSEPLRGVVSLKLYSVTIPYSWYTVSNAYGANFFYLKGNVPGLETGEHDYKISVRPGTYSPADLATALNQGIAEMITLHPDVDFGSASVAGLTKVVYNNNSASVASGTGKTNLEINIRKLFHESSYRIEFPIGSYGNTSTLAGYLGFGQGQLGSIAGGNATSNYIPVASILSVMQFTAQDTSFEAPSSNIQLKIRPYVSPLPYVSLPSSQYFMENVVSNGVITGTKILEATIVLPVTAFTFYTRAQLISMLDTALRTDTSNKLDTANCGAEWVDGRVQMRVKWNSRAFPAANISDEHKKCAVIFPYVKTSSEITRFWCKDELSTGNDNSSVFGFSMNRGTVNVPRTVTIDNNTTIVNDLFPVLDTHVHIGTNAVAKSRFDLGSTNTISLKCNLTGYNNQSNHYDFPISSVNNGYKLPALLDAINASIRTNGNSSQIFTIGDISKQTSIYQKINHFIEWKTWINKSFVNADYTYQIKGSILPNIFGKPSTHNPEIIPSFINLTVPAGAVVFDPASDFILFTPLPNRANYDAGQFKVTFTGGINSDTSFLTVMQSSFQNFTASLRNPFSETTVVQTPTGFRLNFDLSFDLTYQDFTLDFTAAPDIRSQLFFSNTTYLLSSNDTVTSSFACPANLLTVAINSTTGISNGVMRLVPIPSIAGLQTTVDNRYIIETTVPPGTYNHTEVMDILNQQLNANVLSSSTYCTLSAYDAATYNPLTGLSTKLTYVRFSVDIMQQFTTKDFRVVFYDPFSFITCTSSQKNRTIQNVTWDTTIGYILGFRRYIIYYLTDYVGLVDNGGQVLNYYGTNTGGIDKSNICYMISDTVTSTDLYKYFMIMLDDYVQNRVNDGVVSLAKQDIIILPEPYIMVCNPATKQLVPRPLDFDSPGVTYTEKQLIAFQQKVASVQVQENVVYSRRPFVKDIFAVIPLKGEPAVGKSYTEFGGSLQEQERSYFGPVNIHRMTIRLVNDRGELVDTNGVDWNISLVCEQLYKNI